MDLNELSKELIENVLSGASESDVIQLLTDNYQALQLHKTQVSGSFIYVSEETPPSNIELLAKSPTGQIHLCNWRPAYNIFTCQSKRESSFDWQWKLVE